MDDQIITTGKVLLGDADAPIECRVTIAREEGDKVTLSSSGIVLLVSAADLRKVLK
jgi:hypothetical protein